MSQYFPVKVTIKIKPNFTFTQQQFINVFVTFYDTYSLAGNSSSTQSTSIPYSDSYSQVFNHDFYYGQDVLRPFILQLNYPNHDEAFDMKVYIERYYYNLVKGSAGVMDTIFGMYFTVVFDIDRQNGSLQAKNQIIKERIEEEIEEKISMAIDRHDITEDDLIKDIEKLETTIDQNNKPSYFPVPTTKTTEKQNQINVTEEVINQVANLGTLSFKGLVDAVDSIHILPVVEGTLLLNGIKEAAINLEGVTERDASYLVHYVEGAIQKNNQRIKEIQDKQKNKPIEELKNSKDQESWQFGDILKWGRKKFITGDEQYMFENGLQKVQNKYKGKSFDEGLKEMQEKHKEKTFQDGLENVQIKYGGEVRPIDTESEVELIDTSSKPETADTDTDADFIRFFNHEKRHFEGLSDKTVLEEYWDHFEKYGMSFIDKLLGGRESNVDKIILEYALRHKDQIKQMDHFQFHEFIRDISKRDYNGDGEITHIDQIIRERLVHRLKKYREKHGQVVMSIDKNPISQFQQQVAEDVESLAEKYLTPQDAISLHDYIVNVEAKGVLGQETWSDALKAGLVKSLLYVLETTSSVLNIVNNPIISTQNLLANRPMLEGISTEQAVTDVVRVFHLLGTVWVGAHAHQLAMTQGLYASTKFLALTQGKQLMAQGAEEVASKLMLEYGVAEYMGPYMQKAVSAAIAYQIFDSFPMDEVTALGASAFSGMFFNQFIMQHSDTIVRKTANRLTSTVLTFVSPEPKEMKAFFFTYQAANMARELNNLYYDVLQVPRLPTDLPSIKQAVLHATRLKKQKNDQDWFNQMEVSIGPNQYYSPRNPLPAVRTQVQAPAVYGNVDYGTVMPGYISSVQDLAGNNQRLANQAIDIMNRAGIQNRYTPYLMHLIGGVATIFGTVGLTYNYGTGAVIDKAKTVQSKFRDTYKSIATYTSNSTVTPQKVLDIAVDTLGDGNKTFGEMASTLGEKILEFFPKNTTIKLPNMPEYINTKDIDLGTLTKVGLIALSTVGTTYSLHNFFNANAKTPNATIPNVSIPDETIKITEKPSFNLSKTHAPTNSTQLQIIFPPKVEKIISESYEKQVQAPSVKLIFADPEQRAARHAFQQTQYNSFKGGIRRRLKNKYQQASSILGKRFSRGYIYDQY